MLSMSRNGRPNQHDPYEEVLLSFDRFDWDESKRESNIERPESIFAILPGSSIDRFWRGARIGKLLAFWMSE